MQYRKPDFSLDRYNLLRVTRLLRSWRHGRPWTTRPEYLSFTEFNVVRATKYTSVVRYDKKKKNARALNPWHFKTRHDCTQYVINRISRRWSNRTLWKYIIHCPIFCRHNIRVSTNSAIDTEKTRQSRLTFSRVFCALRVVWVKQLLRALFYSNVREHNGEKYFAAIAAMKENIFLLLLLLIVITIFD